MKVKNLQVKQQIPKGDQYMNKQNPIPKYSKNCQTYIDEYFTQNRLIQQNRKPQQQNKQFNNKHFTHKTYFNDPRIRKAFSTYNSQNVLNQNEKQNFKKKNEITKLKNFENQFKSEILKVIRNEFQILRSQIINKSELVNKAQEPKKLLPKVQKAPYLQKSNDNSFQRMPNNNNSNQSSEIYEKPTQKFIPPSKQKKRRLSLVSESTKKSQKINQTNNKKTEDVLHRKDLQQMEQKPLNILQTDKELVFEQATDIENNYISKAKSKYHQNSQNQKLESSSKKLRKVSKMNSYETDTKTFKRSSLFGTTNKKITQFNPQNSQFPILDYISENRGNKYLVLNKLMFVKRLTQQRQQKTLQTLKQI